MEGLGQNILDARSLLGKRRWLAAYSLCSVSRQLPGAKETHFSPLQPCLPTHGTKRTIKIFNLEESNFIWKKKMFSDPNLKNRFDVGKVRKTNSILLIWSLVDCGLVLTSFNSSQTHICWDKSTGTNGSSFPLTLQGCARSLAVESLAVVMYKVTWNYAEGRDLNSATR